MPKKMKVAKSVSYILGVLLITLGLIPVPVLSRITPAQAAVSAQSAELQLVPPQGSALLVKPVRAIVSTSCKNDKDCTDAMGTGWECAGGSGNDKYCTAVAPTCGANAHLDGTTCVCDPGYEGDPLAGCALTTLTCGANAHQESTACVCDAGYHADGAGACVVNVTCTGEHQVVNAAGTACVCDVGYHADGSGVCVADTGGDLCPNIGGEQTSLPAHMLMDANGYCVCESGWHHTSNYKECEPDPVNPGSASLSVNGSCFTWSGPPGLSHYLAYLCDGSFVYEPSYGGGGDSATVCLGGPISRVDGKGGQQYSTAFGTCTVIDLCTNISGDQSSIPAGMIAVNGECFTDVCPNISGAQSGVPAGMILDGGQCLEDVCSNLTGAQPTVPIGYLLVNGSCEPDVCSNLDGAQSVVPTGYLLVNGSCEEDVCSNLDGAQSAVPAGYLLVNGSCELDVCSNLDGAQSAVPSGYLLVNGSCEEDVCPNIDGAQSSVPANMVLDGGLCLEDVCSNITGAQSAVPAGMTAVNGECFGDVCPNITGIQDDVPTGMILLDGQCVQDDCPNLPGAQSGVPAGYLLVNGSCVEDVCSNLDGAQSLLPVGYLLVDGVCLTDVCSNLEDAQQLMPEGYQLGTDGLCYQPTCGTLGALNYLTNAGGVYDPALCDYCANEGLQGADYVFDYRDAQGMCYLSGPFGMLLDPVCTPSGQLAWSVENPNAFAVNASWSVAPGGLSGGGVVNPGITPIGTTVPGSYTFTVSWTSGSVSTSYSMSCSTDPVPGPLPPPELVTGSGGGESPLIIPVTGLDLAQTLHQVALNLGLALSGLGLALDGISRRKKK